MLMNHEIVFLVLFSLIYKTPFKNSAYRTIFRI